MDSSKRKILYKNLFIKCVGSISIKTSIGKGHLKHNFAFAGLSKIWQRKVLIMRDWVNYVGIPLKLLHIFF